MTYTPRVVHLPGTKLTPEVVLHRTLGKLERIKAVTVVIQWDDDTYDVDWSQQRVSEICMGSMYLQDNAMKVIYGKEDSVIREEPA